MSGHENNLLSQVHSTTRGLFVSISVCSDVVTFQTSVTAPASGSMVTHPRTGNKVVIDLYAEKYGVSQYLGKTITITVYEGGTAANPKIRAVATCGGSVVYSTTFATQAEKLSFISMIQSYGG